MGNFARMEPAWYPVYEMFVGDAYGDGVVALSLVDKPAIEESWKLFSAQQELDLTPIAETKRQMVFGPMMVPDKLIYRAAHPDNGLPFYMSASVETVRHMAHAFARKGSTRAVTLNHEKPLDVAYLAESWIIEDPATDKSAALGFTGLPTGTWMVGMHVPDEAFWREHIESGRLTGFSVECGHFGLLKTDQRKLADFSATPNETPKPQPNKPSIMNYIQKIKKWLHPSRVGNLSMQGVPFRIGETDALLFIAEDGTATMVPVTGGEVIAVPDGEYAVGDATVVIEGGKATPGKTETMELGAEDFATYKANGFELALPLGFEESELFGPDGTLVGMLRFEKASGGQTNPADSTKPADPTEVAQLRSQVADLERQVAALSAKPIDKPGHKGTPAHDEGKLGEGDLQEEIFKRFSAK